MEPIRKIGFVANKTKPHAEQLSNDLVKLARKNGVDTVQSSDYPLPKGFLKDADLCCVIGGDGTILGLVKEAVTHNVPVIGINLGKLGFLSAYTVEEAKSKFVNILQGDYNIAERTLLASKNNAGQVEIALNDVVIKLASSKLAHFAVYSGHQLVNEYACDGLIFSTPTGSTAYNLSAGGPLIHPASAVVAMTPICPHTLSNRSFIFGDQTQLRVVCVNSNPTVYVSMDGHSSFHGSDSFPVEIAVHPKRLKLAQHTAHSYYRIVRSKLNWGRTGSL